MNKRKGKINPHPPGTKCSCLFPTVFLQSKSCVPNVIQNRVCQEKVMHEYQSLLCWERGVRRVLGAIRRSLNKSQGGSEASVSLLAPHAGRTNHAPALLWLGAGGSHSPGNPEPRFGVAPVFPVTCQGERCICRVLSCPSLKTTLPDLGAGGVCVAPFQAVWGHLQRAVSQDLRWS